MVTEAKPSEIDTGLRLLARMIARAQLKELPQRQAHVLDSKEQNEEEGNGNKRRV